MTASAKDRATAFCQRFGLRAPVLLAPMAGACPAALSAAVVEGGGMGAMGALLSPPEEIVEWARSVRSQSDGPFQINLWIPQAPPPRDSGGEAAVRRFLETWGPAPPADAGSGRPLDFSTQCDAALAAEPAALSSIMGLFPADIIRRIKASGAGWWATVTTVREAIAAEGAGADVIVAQGAEAGGHRGAFDPDLAERSLIGLFALVPRIADVVRVPVVAAGGIADARGVAAALGLGASAVQIGTAFLRCPEAGLPTAWTAALSRIEPEDTEITRAFSGRPGRAISTDFVRAARAPDAPAPVPYPIQRGLTASMRANAMRQNRVAGMQAWAGQAARLGTPGDARTFTRTLWQDAQRLLP